MARQANLHLVGPDTLRQPTLFVAMGAGWAPETFADLEAMARRIVELRGAAEGLRINPAATDCFYPDLASFKGFSLYRLDAAGEEWFATAALLGQSRDRLEAAVRAIAERAAA